LLARLAPGLLDARVERGVNLLDALVAPVMRGGDALARQVLALLQLAGNRLFDVGQRQRPRLFVDVRHDVEREVQDALQIARRKVEQQTDATRCALEIPDMTDGRGQLDVPHALAAHLGAGYLDPALITDDALEADALVLAAGALPVLRRTEDALAEEAILLGLERTIIDCLRLGHLAVAPRANLLRAGETDADGVEIVDFEH